MPLDRQTIEKRDFPISRRGYETVAVDAHLAEIAREVEVLQAAPATSAPAPASLASSASDRIRGIVEAAETTAADIERQAQEQADAARAAATDEASATRAAASSEAQAHVGAVQEATALMLRRVSALESEVTGLLEHLRTAAASIGSDLATLHTQVAEVGGLGTGPVARAQPAASGTPAPVASTGAVVEPAASGAPAAIASAGAVVEPAASGTPAAVASPGAVAEPAASGTPAPVTPASVASAGAVAEPATPAPAPAAPELPLSDLPAPAERSSDEGGARMVALNLVLDGVPRDEIERHLDERYVLEDRASLLDDLYAKQG